ncbi:MAG: hypothetical protein ABIJ27_07070 [Candidatus Omnitrophota bacterium]
MVNDANLSKRLKALGFPLFETDQKTEDVNRTLADVVKSHNLRFWEGFPVMLANSALKSRFDHNKVIRYLKNPSDRSCFNSLIVLSLALYKALGLVFTWSGSLYATLTARHKKEHDLFIKKIRKNDELEFGHYTISAERLKVTFKNYFTQSGQKLNELLLKKEELEVEYALSRVFSPKQKELFLKKIRGEYLTKTEREYYSRAVKKKVLALANPELHRLAGTLLH